MHTEFMKNFCPRVLIADIGEKVKDLCLEWLDIAFNVCLDHGFSPQAPRGHLLNWLMNLATRKTFNELPQKLEADYSMYSRKPYNLTASECSELMTEIYNDFVKSPRKDYLAEPIVTANEHNTKRILDFFLLLIFFLIFACITSRLLSKAFPLFNLKVDLTNSAEHESKGRSDIAQPNPEILQQETPQSNESGPKSIDKIDEDMADESMIVLNTSEEAESEFFEVEPSVDAQQIPEEHEAEPQESTSPTHSKLSVRKRSENFLDINIKNMEPKTELMQGQTSHSSRCPTSKKFKQTRSLIPIRTLYPNY